VKLIESELPTKTPIARDRQGPKTGSRYAASARG
jgi:hypothetical protein